MYFYFGLGIIARTISKNKKSVVKNVFFYPIVKDTTILSDLMNRVSWYFPESPYSNVNVFILTDDKLCNTDISSLTPPSSQYNYIGKSQNIKLVQENECNLHEADAILLWKKKNMFDVSILKNLAIVHIVDPTYYFSVEAETYHRRYVETLGKKEREYFSSLSSKNYQLLLNNLKNYKKAFIFGTGPSLEKKALDFDYSEGFRLVCNTIVNNKTLMDHIDPHVLVFGDAQHHLGPSIYAETFRQAAINAAKSSQCYLLTKNYAVPLLLAHYPELKDKIIGIEAPSVWDLSPREIIRMVITKPWEIPWFDKIPGHNERFNFPTLDKFYIRTAGSVLPSYMIPLASSLCNEIYILGADGRDPNGRKPDETYIWSYSSSCQFEDLKETTFKTHPSYFRDRPYTEVFDIYSEIFEELLKYGESLGRKYFSLAPSYIPSLAKRPVPDKKPPKITGGV